VSDRPPPTGPWQPSDGESDRPAWDQEEADDFVGLIVLVGVTYVEADGQTVTSQAQYYGRIVGVDRIRGIEVACEGKWAGKTMTLPPALRSLHYARPGQYTLRATGETIENPDFTASFTVTAPLKS
jgi:hypothetical protein